MEDGQTTYVQQIQSHQGPDELPGTIQTQALQLFPDDVRVTGYPHPRDGVDDEHVPNVDPPRYQRGIIHIYLEDTGVLPQLSYLDRCS